MHFCCICLKILSNTPTGYKKVSEFETIVLPLEIGTEAEYEVGNLCSWQKGRESVRWKRERKLLES
jgi:hypothetical protein